MFLLIGQIAVLVIDNLGTSNLTFKASYSLTADRGPSSVSNSLAIIQAFNAWRPFTDVSE